MSAKPLIAHVLYRLDVGGMERFILTLINHTTDRYRHALICLDDFGPLRSEIEDPSVRCIALHKHRGKDLLYYIRLLRALRALRPDLVQTYNFGTLDVAPFAHLAGVRHVVHAERGRDASDPNGSNRRYQRLHRWMSPLITRFIAVSHDLQTWLVKDVGIDPGKTQCIGNGIDVTRYKAPERPAQVRPLLGKFAPRETLLIINVGRLDRVKDQAGLIDAFAMLYGADVDSRSRLRLAVAGEGPEHESLQCRIDERSLAGCVRLLGVRNDIPAILAEADVFVLSSIAEGMPGVLLEAMAAGLPVVATRVGGVGDVVVDGQTGTLVTPGDPAALAAALTRYVHAPDLRQRHGAAGLARVRAHFGLAPMVSAYVALYDEVLSGQSRRQQTGRAAIGLPEQGRH